MRPFLIITFLIISSCASLNEDDCKNGKWDIIGVRDGSEGRPISYLQNHEKACSEYDIKIDYDLYKKSWKEGIEYYCTPENGLSIGLNGKKYHNVCKNEGFLKRYNLGRKAYQLSREVSALEREISEYENNTGDSSILEQIFSISDYQKKKKELKRKEATLYMLNAKIIQLEPGYEN